MGSLSGARFCFTPRVRHPALHLFGLLCPLPSPKCTRGPNTSRPVVPDVRACQCGAWDTSRYSAASTGFPLKGRKCAIGVGVRLLSGRCSEPARRSAPGAAQAGHRLAVLLQPEQANVDNFVNAYHHRLASSIIITLIIARPQRASGRASVSIESQQEARLNGTSGGAACPLPRQKSDRVARRRAFAISIPLLPAPQDSVVP